jgi:alpha-D-xyloside xylohydrolase
MLDRQYMLGESLLVAPIFNKEGTVQYYLPDGEWISLLNGNKVAGGHWQSEKHDFLSLPLMVRPGTVLPMGARDNTTEYDYTDGVELHVFMLGEGQTAMCRIPALDGTLAATYTVTIKNGEAVVETDSSKPYTVVLHN